MIYRSVVLGGTFDGLHAGHQALIAKAFAVGQYVTIGLTTDEYVKKIKNQKSKIKSKKSVFIQSFAQRKKILEDWLVSRGWQTRATILPLEDTYGLTLQRDVDYQAIVVSSDTEPVAQEINAQRVAVGLSPFVIVAIPLVPAEDGQAISSTRMRRGEIDELGNLVMPEGLRSALGQPLGTVLTGQSIRQSLVKHAQDRVVVVGDMATKTVLDAGVVPSLVVVDGKVGRKPYGDAIALMRRWSTAPKRIVSGPGYIAKTAVDRINAWSRAVAQANPSPTLLLIEGEEDLLVLPALLAASAGSIIYYGQPAEGLVEVIVTPQKKEVAQRLLDQFT